MRPLLATRVRDRHGLIGILTMAIMLMLVAVSLAIFITVNATIYSTRSSRDFLRARENLDSGTADALYNLNTSPATTSGHGYGDDNMLGHPSTWKWAKTTYDPQDGPLAGGDIKVDAVDGNSTTQTMTRAWRTRYVGSRTGSADDPTYGVAAESAWTAAISTENDSQVDGTVRGDWHAYGTGTITVPTDSTVPRIISYDDKADAKGNVGDFTRSTLSATLDERLLDDRVTRCGTSLNRWIASEQAPGPGPAILPAGQISCYFSITIDKPTIVAGSGVADVISYGPININSSITTLPTNQLHLYTASGTVKFRGGQTVDAYIYAPNALCKTWDAATVTYVGSLACRQVLMQANFTGPGSQSGMAALPYLGKPATGPTDPRITYLGNTSVDNPSQTVTYLESPGYRDQFGN